MTGLMVFGSLLGQLTRVDDPRELGEGSLLQISVLEPGGPVETEFAAHGIRFRGIDSTPTVVVHFDPTPTLGEILRGIRNVPLLGGSENKPFIVTFEFPVSEASFMLANGDAETQIEMKAFTPTGDLLGTIHETGADNERELFIGLITSHPDGIATVVIDYGDDPAAEEIDTVMSYKSLAPPTFTQCLPQIAHATAGSKQVSTTIGVYTLDRLGNVSLQLFDPSGSPSAATLNGETASVFELVLSSRPQELATTGSSNFLVHGCLTSDEPIGAYAVYSVSSGGEPISALQAGISATTGHLIQVAPLKKIQDLGVDTAIAVSNLSDEETEVRFELVFESDRDNILNNPRIVLPPRGQKAFFLGQLCQITKPGPVFCKSDFLADGDFDGSAWITSNQPVAITTVRTINGMPVLSLPVASLGQ